MVKNNSITKVAITGSTLLTLNSMREIIKLKKYKIIYVFGISDENKLKKTNSVDLKLFCKQNNILLDESEDWKSCHTFCTDKDIDLIISLGDSRIVPNNIVNNFEVLGNHGARLPSVQGGASLVWGRLLNYYYWDVSIMKLRERVDSGEILKSRQFHYHENTTEREFTTRADSETVEILIEVLKGNFKPIENKKWQVRIAKHTDSYLAVEILKFCLDNQIPIYLPPRTPKDGIIKKHWPKDFIDVFKKANNCPYPKWSEE